MTTLQQPRKTPIIPLMIIGGLYFTFGFVSWVNAILIPYFKIACELTHMEAYLVTLAFYIAYLVMSIPASKLLDTVGFKKGMMYGLWFMAIGALLFVPAAYTRTYGIFLTGLFSIGTGLAILQTAANPYVTVIGPIESAARRMSMMGLCNKFAGIISPLIFAAVVLKTSDSELFAQLEQGILSNTAREAALDELIRRVMLPYTLLALLLFSFSLFIRYSSLPDINPQEQNKDEHEEEHSGRKSVVQFPYLILGAVAMFFHAGSQVISIDTIINYAGTMDLDLNQAKSFPSYTMSCTLIGYCLGILLIPRFLSQKRALQICTVTNLILSFCVIFVSGKISIMGYTTDMSIWFLVLMGLSNALIYTGIWPLAIRGLGKFTNRGSSFLVMGLCGNAFLPVIYGAVADKFDVRLAYWTLVPCFLYLIFYAFVGHKIEYWSKKSK